MFKKFVSPSFFFYWQSCYERGKQILVFPKTCSSSDASWIGLAKYAWAGYGDFVEKNSYINNYKK